MFLDFAKAFDKVPHNRLLLKLSNYGIQGQVYNWIKDWLINRYQRVIIDGKSLSSQPVLSSVPQGTVLGPLMFLVFILLVLHLTYACLLIPAHNFPE